MMPSIAQRQSSLLRELPFSPTLLFRASKFSAYVHTTYLIVILVVPELRQGLKKSKNYGNTF